MADVDFKPRTKQKTFGVVGYATVGDVVEGLKNLRREILENRLNRGEYEALKNIVVQVLKEEIDIFDLKNVNKLIKTFQNWSGERPIEEIVAEQPIETKLGSRALNSKELEILVAEYEAELAKGQDGSRTNKLFEELTGQSIENFIQRRIEIREELEGLEIDEQSRGRLVEILEETELRTSIDSTEELARKATGIVIEELKQDRGEDRITRVEVGIKREIGRMGVSTETSETVENRIVTSTIEASGEVLKGRIVLQAARTINKSLGLGEEKEETIARILNERVTEKFQGRLPNLNSRRTEGTLREEIAQAIGIRPDNRTVGVAIKTGQVILERFLEQNEDQVQQLKDVYLKKIVEDGVRERWKENGIIPTPDQERALGEYIEIVRQFSRPDPKLGAYEEKARVFTEERYRTSPTLIEERMNDWRVVVGALRSAPRQFNQTMERLGELGELIGVKNLPLKIAPVRAVERLKEVVTKVPEVAAMINKAQKVVSFLDKFNNIGYQVLHLVRLDEAAISLAGRFAGQGGVQFAEYSLAVIAEQGFTEQALGTILKGVLFGGFSVGTGTVVTMAGAELLGSGAATVVWVPVAAETAVGAAITGTGVLAGAGTAGVTTMTAMPFFAGATITGTGLAAGGTITVGGAITAGEVTIAGTAAGAGGAIAAAGGPPGWVIGAIIFVAGLTWQITRSIFKRIKEGLGGVAKNLGLDTPGIDNFLRENFGKAGGLIGTIGKGLVTVGTFIVGLPAILAGISVGPFITIAAIGVIVGIPLLTYITVVTPTSSLPPPRLGAGEAVGIGVTDAAGNIIYVPFDPNAPGIPGEKVPGECSVSQSVGKRYNQCSGSWANMTLNGATRCYDGQRGTVCKAGCGPTSVAMILARKSASWTPDKVVFNTAAYSGMGCEGSSLGQAYSVLSAELGAGNVIYDSSTRGCSVRDIANYICKGKIVMYLADYYFRSYVGGHFALAVAVSGGDIITYDPYFSTTTPFSGKRDYGYVARLRECLVVNASAVR